MPASPQQRAAKCCRLAAAASCKALSTRRSSELQRSASLPAALRSKRRRLPSLSSAHSTSVGLSSDFRRTFIRLPLDFRRTFVRPTSYLRHRPTSLLTSSSYVLLASSTCRPLPCCPVDLTSCRLHVLRDTILQSCVLHIVVMHLVVLCLVAYLVAFCRTIVVRLGRFKPYIVLEFCN